LWQILQQVCAVELERPVRPTECIDDECAAHWVLWMVESSGRVDAGESAGAEVVSDSKTMRIVRERSMGHSAKVSVTPNRCSISAPLGLISTGRRNPLTCAVIL